MNKSANKSHIRPFGGVIYISYAVNPTLHVKSLQMSPDDIIHHMASDFSQCMSYFLPDWEHNDEPGDAYTDTIISGFGEAPTESSVIDAYKSGAAVPAIRAELNDGWETDIFTEDIIDRLVQRAIINNFGPDALS